MNHSGILRWCGEVHFPLALVTSRKLARTRVTRALEGLPARGLSFVYRSDSRAPIQILPFIRKAYVSVSVLS